MADATDIPILLDADTGYGNFNNARRLVRKLEDRGIAGTKIKKIIAFPLSYCVVCFAVVGLLLGYNKWLYTAKLMYVHYFVSV